MNYYYQQLSSCQSNVTAAFESSHHDPRHPRHHLYPLHYHPPVHYSFASQPSSEIVFRFSMATNGTSLNISSDPHTERPKFVGPNQTDRNPLIGTLKLASLSSSPVKTRRDPQEYVGIENTTRRPLTLDLALSPARRIRRYEFFEEKEDDKPPVRKRKKKITEKSLDQKRERKKKGNKRGRKKVRKGSKRRKKRVKKFPKEKDKNYDAKKGETLSRTRHPLDPRRLMMTW